MKITLLVPILNEIQIVRSSLARLYVSLSEMKATSIQWEVTIADAGSSDGSAEAAKQIAQKHGWCFVSAPLPSPSIGKTINLGLSAASGNLILVLPCDCQLSQEALDSFTKKVEAGFYCGGFVKRYSPSSFRLSIYAFLQNFIRVKRLRHLVWTNGMFFKKSQLEGNHVPDVGFLEDVELSDRIRKDKNWTIIEKPILVSARKYFPHRISRRIVLNILIIFLYRTGIQKDLQKLKRLYQSLG